MNPAAHVLAIDQGTTSTRAIVFNAQARTVALARREFAQHYPASGWVEHDAEDIWHDTVEVVREAIERAGCGPQGIAALGITNQRETTVVWERATGRPIHRAIVWQDRRTADECARLKLAGAEALVSARTGLLLDPYFSATKLAWILDNVAGARARAERGELAFGTIDSFLLWRLTGGRVHATDATNASRTLLFDIHRQEWDEELLALLRVPRALLPQVRDSSEVYGASDAALFGRALPDRRHRRGPAGGPVRPGVLCAGHGQVHLRHRLLRAAQYRLRRGGLQEPHADHGRLPHRRAHHLRDGRLDLHRRRGREVAARRPQGHRQRRGDRHRGRGGAG